MNRRKLSGVSQSLVLTIAIAAGLSGCAGTQAQNKESLLIAAGFHVRTPSTGEQWAMYNQMTPYKLERNTPKGKALYTFADKRKGIVYVGGDKAYEHYKQLRMQQSTAQNELEASYSEYLDKIDREWGENYD
jgi:hypothetical protein